MNQHDADILIAGGGTVGLAAAAALSTAGFKVVLIERGAPPLAFDAKSEVDARVYALSPQSIRLLDRLGVWPTIAAARHSPYRAMQVWHDDPASALRFEGAPDQTLGSIVEHGLLNAALWAQGGDWLRLSNAGISSVSASEDEGAAVTLQDGRTLTAKLLVIADGPDSPLRGELGIDSIGWDYSQRAIVAHVRAEQPHGGIARQRFLPTGPLALLPLADGRCSLVWSCGTVMAEELLALDDAAFGLRLSTATGQVLGGIKASSPRRSFPLRLGHVPAPVVPGAVVIGDAAHVIHPLAGQGVNLGLADAETLAASLATARDAQRGWWRERTLKAYARARRPETVEMLAMTDGLSRAFTSPAALRRLLGDGMTALNRAGPIKQWLLSRAAGASI